VTRSLALLDLPDDVQERVEAGELAARSAYEVARLEDDGARHALAEAVRQQGLTAEETRRAVRSRQGKAAPASRSTRERFSAPGGLTVTVRAARSLTDAEVEAALVHALEVVRGRAASAIAAEPPKPR
jgi:hypothetical protein